MSQVVPKLVQERISSAIIPKGPQGYALVQVIVLSLRKPVQAAVRLQNAHRL